jgi:hypothetical protein
VRKQYILLATIADIVIIPLQVLLRWRQACGYPATPLHTSLQQVSKGAVVDVAEALQALQPLRAGALYWMPCTG